MMHFGKWSISLTRRGWLAVILGLCVAIVLLVLAWTIGLVAVLLGLLVSVLNVLWAAVLWVLAQLGVLSALGWIIAQVTAIWGVASAWFATTWLGQLLLPVYGWLAPILRVLSPLFTMSKWSKKLWQKAKVLQRKGVKTAQEAEHVAEGDMEILPPEDHSSRK